MILLMVLPLTAFFFLWVLIIACKPQDSDRNFHLQEAFIQASLFWCGLLALGTELLSLFTGLTTLGVAILWLSVVLFLGSLLWRSGSFNPSWMRIRQGLTRLFSGWFESILVVIIVVILLILLITGLMAPPNIHDVLTYHMSRVMHWVQNRSVSFFPTSITWQLYYPPFSEFSQVHWQLLAGGDTLSAFPQWYSLVFILVIVMTIAKRMGVDQRGQWIAALFMVSVPIVVLQASNGKNDIVLTFFFAVLAYFVVKAVDQPLTLLDWVSSGVAFGLGVMTKGHFVFFSIPLLLWLLITQLRKSGWKKTLNFAGIGILSTLFLNGGHWVRNTLTFGNPTNTSDAGFIINGRFGLDVLISNLSRNTALQLSSVGFVNQRLEVWLAELHTWMGLALFDQAITLGPKVFFHMPIREEVAGNPVHFGITGLVFLVVIVLTFKHTHRHKVLTPLLLSLSAIVGMIIFSAVFRWQAWGTRYFIFYYALFAPVVGYLAGSWRPQWASGLLVFVLVAVMLNPLLNNYSRSFSWSENNRNSIWRMSRRGLRFANHRIYEGAVLEMTHLMDISRCRTYGMSIGGNSPEYLIWGTLTPDSRDYFLEHTGVDNPSAVHATENFDPCGIIVFEAAPPETALTGDYRLYKGWPLEGYEGLPLTLYLKPDIISQNLE